MNKKTKVVAVGSFVAALFAFAAHADTIQNKNGHVLEGRIIEESDKAVVMDVPHVGEVTVYRDEIQSITRGKGEEAVTETAPAPELVAPAEAPKPQRDLSSYERPLIPFDDRKWKVGYQNAVNNMLITEFVLEGETVENWTELVTVQLFIGLETATPEAMVSTSKKILEETCKSPYWKELKKGENDILYEWSIKGCSSGPDQSELSRVIRGKDGMHVIHYAIKKVPMPKDKRARWIEALTKTEIVKDAQAMTAAIDSKGTPQARANAKGNRGVALIQQGDLDGGLALIKEATKLDPTNPGWHLNYASFLGMKAVRSANAKEKISLSDETIRELEEAIKYFDKKKDQEVIAHCYFLLGDINFYGKDNLKEAKKNYEKSFDYSPNNAEARDGITRWFNEWQKRGEKKEDQ